MEYYLAMKMDGALIHATKWMNLKNIMLREVKQTHQVICCMTLLT